MNFGPLLSDYPSFSFILWFFGWHRPGCRRPPLHFALEKLRGLGVCLRELLRISTSEEFLGVLHGVNELSLYT